MVWQAQMIISHKHKFIFLKTRKTAGTSIEMWLQAQCGSNDIVTPIFPPEPNHVPRNYEGWFNPLFEIFACSYLADNKLRSWRHSLGDLWHKRRYYRHIPGRVVRSRVPALIWNSYWKWCVERDPLEKVSSHYFMERARHEGDLSPAEYLKRCKLPLNFSIYCEEEGSLLVNQIINYKKLEEELGELSIRLGLEFTKLDCRAKTNYRGSDRRSAHEIFDQEQVAYIESSFQQELSILKGIGFTQ